VQRFDGEAGGARPTIGMLTNALPDQSDQQWLGVADAARANGCNYLAFAGGELDDPRPYVARQNAVYDLVSNRRIDALVVWTSAIELYVGHERMERFCSRFAPMPIVSMEQPLGEAPVVRMGDRRGMFDAVSHLVGAHHKRRIAFVRGPAYHSGAEERFQGYVDALAAHNLPPEPMLVTPPSASWAAAEAKAATLRLLQRDPRPDAIVGANDEVALGALAALESMRIESPGEVAVIGFDDYISILADELDADGPGAVPRSDAGRPSTLSLTTVRGPFYDMGWQAVELALTSLAGHAVPPTVTVPTELVVRRSCGCFRAPTARARANTPTTAAVRAAGEVRTRAESAAQLRTELPGLAESLPRGWADALVSAYVSDLRGEGAGFLSLLHDLVAATVRTGTSAVLWWQTLSALRPLVWLPGLGEDAVARDAELWGQIDSLLSDTVERLADYRQLLAAKRERVLSEIGQHLAIASDVAGFCDALAAALPKLGIPSCYVARYAAVGDAPHTAHAELLVACKDGVPHDVSGTTGPFASRDLVPGDELDRPEPAGFVVLPLHFRDLQLGYALLECGPRAGSAYEALQLPLSIALHGVVQSESAVSVSQESARAPRG